MAFLKRGWKLLFFIFVMGPAFADVSPFSLTFFGLYGSPVQPLGLASSLTDIVGFDVLGEWNASNYASLGLSFEQADFYSDPAFSFSTINIEGRVFPFQNEKEKFSPYLYGGAGLGVSTGGGTLLKAGLGSRVSFIGSLFLDFTAGSHWIVSPANAQYVDFRAGLSYSFELKPPKEEKPAPTATAIPAVSTPKVQATVPMASPVPTATQMSLEMATPTPMPVIFQAPVTTLAQSKKFYKIGMDAFLAGNYPLALKALKKSLTLKEKHKHPYKYAETYATIGVIYQFHAHKVKDHDKKALIYYKKALAIDPTTKSAKHYYKKLKAKLARESKHKPKPIPAPVSEGTQPSTSGDALNPPTPSGTGQSLNQY